MTNSDFEHILHQMSKNDMEKWLQIKGHPFDSFADALAEGNMMVVCLTFITFSSNNISNN